ncbi:rRNA maturation RNase YbeY [Paenirhodobacter sp.]|uniref:rRNA maturation RNase YbeY n=1 Tax=Paenirhodobacter sp. TaxID=1965326 RepID=UPI003B5046D2
MEPLVDIIIEDERWQDLLPALAETAAQAVLADQGLDPAAFEVSLLGCDDARIAVLNAEFRGKPAPTNVLSWPSQDLAPEAEGTRPDLPEPFLPDERESLGDIAIAWETCAREAEEQGKSLHDHVLHLIVHGILHLLGYDHIREGDAALMEGTEVRVLDRMGISDPYES